MAGYQTNRASCGPAALSNALEALGIERTEAELITLTGQNANGTSPRQLIRAIKSIQTDLRGDVFKVRGGGEATIALWHSITQAGRPVILCVDAHEHWVCCTGYIGERFVLVDSAEVGLVFYYTADELVERWIGPKGGYYGVIV
jgi:ABC-type bacteriocin/lantibiotic exporter with double-glycine peptidase domain